MVSENIVLDDVHSVSSSVKFRNSGILKAVHIGKLNTDKVIFSEVLMVPGLTRNFISEETLDDKGCFIIVREQKGCMI